MSVVEEERSLNAGKKSITVLITRPAKPAASDVCFVLGHGASGDATIGNLPAIAARLADVGVPVIRYTCAGQLPARVKALEAVMDSDLDGLQGVKRWILAGHSMGGRTACAVARARKDVAGVVLFSYPLHPPGKQEELRDQDLTALDIPVLIVRGTKDPFSTEDVFQAAMKRMTSSKLQISTVQNGDHSLGTKTKIGQERFEEWISDVQKFVQEAFHVTTTQAAGNSKNREGTEAEATSKEAPSGAKRKPAAKEKGGASRGAKKAKT